MRRAPVLMVLIVLIVLVAAGIAAYALIGRAEPTEEVSVSGGRIRGKWTPEANIALFSGIPYAAPPVGVNRWRAPQPVLTWDGVREATEFGAECIQDRTDYNRLVGFLARGLGLGWLKEQAVLWALRLTPLDESEDCLFLNVRTGNLPGLGDGREDGVEDGRELQPVMVWFHGGGFMNGTGSDPFVQSNALVERGVVLVTLNYRLGPFGFFAHPALTAEGPDSGSGNYGFLDQIAALQWVRDNIAGFGGDPDNVTIFGESAGSISVSDLLASPLARGLFHKAILESGVGSAFGGMLHARGLNRLSAEDAGSEFAEKLGFPNASAADLRAIPAENVLDCLRECEELTWMADDIGPVVDGYALPESVGQAILDDSLAPVPILDGFNADEGTAIFPFLGSPTVWERPMPEGEDIREFLEPHFGTDTERLIRLYGLDDPARADTGMVEMTGDDWFGVHHRLLNARHAARGLPVFAYFFTRVPPSPDQTLGAFHGAEIPFVFGSHDGFFFEATDEDWALTDTMIRYWTNFARTGDPNGPGLPRWPAYDPSTDTWLVLDHEIRTQTGLRRDRLDALAPTVIRKTESLAAQRN